MSEDGLHRTERLDAILTALAHPVRRRLLELLEFGAATAGDLSASAADSFGISPARASQHLRVLAHAGLVDVMPDGTHRWYSLADGAADDIADWLARLRLSRARGAGR
ncbi:metalloregulator ArsR/SmtB family transcription factor [Demequina sp. SYSU T00192]|uniref:Metalloregulator ArsR/SmtB family transcription factor n=1 Tax=Demequina litoralis TaxID=3051660 RepID=A0ABT8GAH8_9MICO|nr:metalloregulator ArsR/SmtB family transcription factor [Demequina sp. SYSU T00192]MDN4475974.1 metalloregulator ArsR/SmtB family transcription factor [Demequina sp. SYSU T00192]